MSQPPIQVDILSDDDDKNNGGGEGDDVLIPLIERIKRRKTDTTQPNPTFLIIDDDDPTPKKPVTSASVAASPLFVAETPMSDLEKSEVRIVKCTSGSTEARYGCTSNLDNKFSGTIGTICLESDDELEDRFRRVNSQDTKSSTDFDVEILEKHCPISNRLVETSHCYNFTHLASLDDNACLLSPSRSLDYDDNNCGHGVNDKLEEEEEEAAIQMKKSRAKGISPKKMYMNEKAGKRKMTKEEKVRLMEERKLKKEQEKLQKAALKAEAAELKKLEKEMHKWEKGKFAVNSIVAQIDRKVVESGSLGGNLLTRLAEKDLKYGITSNPIEGSIVWTMTVPEQFSQISSVGSEVRYILLVYEAEEFCKLAVDESLFNHVSAVRSRYPSYTICCITNRLMSYINRREQEKFKNPAVRSDWRRPPVEEVFATLCTHFEKVHSRQCVDEAEFSDHVVGLTINLAKCRFRKKMTRLSVNANGSFIPKDCMHRDIIRKSPWLKSLVAIPKVQPRFAVAIWKKYPTMKSLLSVYMDPSKSVHEKEFLLKDLMVEGSYGNEDRRLGEVCSKRVYRILMAQSGSILTDDIENGADYFIDTDK